MVPCGPNKNPYFTDPNAPGTYRSTRLVDRQARIQQEQQQQQQQQTAAAARSTAAKAKKGAAPKKAAGGVKKATGKAKGAGAGKKAAKAPAAPKKGAKKAPAKAPKKAPRKAPTKPGKTKGGPSGVPDDDDDGEPSDDAVQPMPIVQEEDEEDAPDGADASEVEDAADDAAPPIQPMTDEDQDLAAAIVASLQQQDQGQDAPPAPPPPPPAVTHEEEAAIPQFRGARPDYGESHVNFGDIVANRVQHYLTTPLYNEIGGDLVYSNVQWAHVENIGIGGFGRADLYIQRDDAGNVLQRIVVKTASVPHDSWIELKHWHIDEHDPRKRQHMEIAAMEAIASVPGNHKCVRLYHYMTDSSRLSYCLYMNYCPRGELSALVNTGAHYHEHQNIIPEPVLWKWLEDLTEACLIFSTGAAPQDQAAEDWKKIVHCDFKPLNVFLDNPDEGIWKSYPQALVGDYGQSVFTDESDPGNPTLYNYGTGTPGWRPPEQVMMVGTRTKRRSDTGQLGDPTNVWAIGAIIISMMNGNVQPDQPGYDANVKGQMEPQLKHESREYYSPYLCALVEECVQFRTHFRAPLPELWESIARYTGKENVKYDPEVDGDDKEYIERLKEAIRDQKYGEGSEDYSLVYTTEDYKIGMAETNDEDEDDSDGGNEDPGRYPCDPEMEEEDENDDY